MADTWTPISGYTPQDYTDTLVFEMSAETKKLEKIVGQALVAGEENSQYIKFVLPRYWDGIDISGKSFGIEYALAGTYYGTSEAVNAEMSTDQVRFGWVVPKNACAISGTLFFVLKVDDTDYVLKSQIADTPVFKTIDVGDVVPEPTKEQWYREFEARVEGAIDDAEAAIEAAQAAQASAEAAAQNAQTAEDNAEAAAASAQTRYGSPLTATTAEEMTDENRVYVYTGSETGYTNGHWYYHNGSAWTDGGVYNAVAVDTDTTLSIAGKPADSKKTGDEISQIKEDFNELAGQINGNITYDQVEENISEFETSRFYINPTTGKAYDFTNRTSYLAKLDGCEKITVVANNTYKAQIAFLTSKEFENNVIAPLVDGELPVLVNTGSTMTVDVPNDSVYLYVRRIDADGHNTQPTNLYFIYKRRNGGLINDAYVTEYKRGETTVIANGAVNKPAISVVLSVKAVQNGTGEPSVENIRSISGTDSVSLTVSESPEGGTPISISFGENAPLYGGTVDIITGVVTVDFVGYSFTGEENFIQSGNWVTVVMSRIASEDQLGFCSHFRYRPYNSNCIGVMRNENNCIFDGTVRSASEWKEFCTEQYNAGTPIQIVYKIKKPFTFTVDPTAIQMANGINYFSTNANDGIAIKYYATVEAVISEMRGDTTEDEATTSTMDDVPTQNSSNAVKSGGIYNALLQVKGMLPFDSLPTPNSQNPVTSNGIATAIANKQDSLIFDETPILNSDNPVKSNGVKVAIDSLLEQLNTYARDALSKISKPEVSPNGYKDQILRSNGDGTTEWADFGLPTNQQTEDAVNKWLDEHPSATTTVLDYSLPIEKLVKGTLGYYTPDMYGAVGDGITDDSSALLAAITAAGIGGVIKLPVNKQYNIGTTGLTLLENQTITGGGALVQTENANVCVLYAVDGTTVDGISIIQKPYVSHTGYGIKIGGSNITIKNCYIYGKYVGMTGDGIYGDNVVIRNNYVAYTRNGIYVSVPATANRRIGLQILDNISVLCEGYDTSISPAQIKGINIGGCSGAIVRGNIILGAGMCYCSYRWTDHVIYDHNISDYYVSVIGDNNVVTNNIVDGELTPEIHFPITTVGMMCAIEVVGDDTTLANNVIKNNSGPAISSNDTYRHGMIISGNYIENCATAPDASNAAVQVFGISDVVIKGNVIRNCGNVNKGYGAICMSSGKRYAPQTNIIICNNIMEGIRNNNTNGAIYIRYAKDVKINGNILECAGSCLSLGVDYQYVGKIDITGNTFKGNIFGTSLLYTNEVRMYNNDFREALVSQDQTDLQELCKNKNNEGLVAKIPKRCTWDLGEIYPTVDGLKRCVEAGTYGVTELQYIYADRVTADTTENSTIIRVNALGGILLNIGQYISVDGAIEKARILNIDLLYENNDIAGANVSLSNAASNTITNADVTYSNPKFTTIR